MFVFTEANPDYVNNTAAARNTKRRWKVFIFTKTVTRSYELFMS